MPQYQVMAWVALTHCLQGFQRRITVATAALQLGVGQSYRQLGLSEMQELAGNAGSFTDLFALVQTTLGQTKPTSGGP